jgi:hypothetical protein
MCGPLAMLPSMVHSNWLFGWSLILIAFITGAGLGLFFHDENFWGGYATFRRRIVRLGHISFAAIGMLNVLYGLTPASIAMPRSADIGLIFGGISMPAVCFLSGWKPAFRHLFFIPVISLMIGVGSILYGALT